MQDNIPTRHDEHRKTMPAVLFFVGIVFLIMAPGLLQLNPKEVMAYGLIGLVITVMSLGMLSSDRVAEKYAIDYLSLPLLHLLFYGELYTQF